MRPSAAKGAGKAKAPRNLPRKFEELPERDMDAELEKLEKQRGELRSKVKQDWGGFEEKLANELAQTTAAMAALKSALWLFCSVTFGAYCYMQNCRAERFRNIHPGPSWAAFICITIFTIVTTAITIITIIAIIIIIIIIIVITIMKRLASLLAMDHTKPAQAWASLRPSQRVARDGAEVTSAKPARGERTGVMLLVLRRSCVVLVLSCSFSVLVLT
ncbi:unnamed protein product [Amoebophrya sp. A25]|nr:unnamed protein product [Amoebophrya sp. A25]|eukprot:GSA25T00003216001.1